jgi:mannitol/fructose-specific phosphotransferase system IIA component
MEPVIVLKKSEDSVRRAFVYNISGISKRTMRVIKMLYEAYRRDRTVKHLSEAFRIKNILKEVSALSPFLFYFVYTMP